MLFNIKNKGSEEIYRATGAFTAATPYSSIENDVIDATDELKSQIGGVVTLAEQDYEGHPEGTDLSRAVQRVVASRALCFFAKNTGLSHGDTGRKLKVDDNEKIPFEWMIDRDDRELREKYFRALNHLYGFIRSSISKEEDSPLAAAWKESCASSSVDGLIVDSAASFESVYPIDGSNYVYYRMAPLMQEAQKRLCTMLETEAAMLAGNQAAIKYIILIALATALSRWSLSVFPLEISRQFAPSFQGNKEQRPATLQEVESTRNAFLREARAAYSEVARAFHPGTGNQDLLPHNHPDNKFFTV